MLEIFVGCICTFCNLFPRKLYCKYLFCVLSSVLKVYRCVYHRCRMRCCPSSVLQRCVRLRPCIRKARSRLPLQIREILAYISVLVQSLYFNSLTDSDVVFDSVFEPVFLTVDYVTRWFGTVSICFFIWNNNRKSFLFGMIGCPLFSFAGVCLSGGPTDQLNRCDSLYCSAASDPQHVLPTLDCLAHLLWTLEPHHDSFPLLQSCQDFPWIPPSSKIMITLLYILKPELNMSCNAAKCWLRKEKAARLCQSAKNASCPNQQEHIIVASVTGECFPVF